MDSSEIHKTDEMERQREQVRALWRHRRYDEAADLAAVLSDEVLLYTPCENIADHVRRKRPEVAARLYDIAVAFWYHEGSLATGSGEGLEAMDHIHAIQAKLKQLAH